MIRRLVATMLVLLPLAWWLLDLPFPGREPVTLGVSAGVSPMAGQGRSRDAESGSRGAEEAATASTDPRIATRAEEPRLDSARVEAEAASGASPVEISIDVVRPLASSGELVITVEPPEAAGRTTVATTLAGSATSARLAAALDDRVVVEGAAIRRAEAVVAREHLDGAPLRLDLAARTRLRGALVALDGGAAPLRATLTFTSERRAAPPATESVAAEFDVAPALEPPWTVEVAAPGFCESRIVAVDDRSPLLIRLARPRSLSGRVVAAGGRPIAGAEVTIGRFGAIPVDERPAGRSDDAGCFAIDSAPAADLVLCARRDGYAPARVEVARARLDGGPIELTLAPQAEFAGVVVDERGAPIVGATLVVGCLSDHLVVGSIATDAAGAYSMPWTAAGRDYHVEVVAPGFERADVGPVTPPRADVRIELRALAPLAVEVVDEGGAAIVGASLQAWRLHDLPEHEAAAVGAPDYAARTDADGRAKLPWLARAPHHVAITAAGRSPLHRLLTPARAATPTRIVLPRARPVHGRWLDGDGAPLAGIRMTPAVALVDGAFAPQPGAPTAASVADGSIALAVADGSAAAPVAFVCEREGHVSLLRWIDGRAPAPTWNWPPCGALEIEIDDELAARATALSFTLETADRVPFAVRLAANGRLVIDGVAAGPLRVRLLDEWLSSTWHCYAAQERSIAIATATTACVRFAAAGATVVGHVANARHAGAAAAASARRRAWAIARDRGDGAAAPAFSSSVELDGRFVLADVPRGRWRVVVVEERTAQLALAEATIALDGRGAGALPDLAWPERERVVALVDATRDTAVADGWIELVADGVAIGRAPLDERGALRLRVPEGADVLVRAGAPGFEPVALPLAEAEERGALRLAPIAAAELRVVVTDAQERPLRGVRVELRAEAGDGAQSAAQVALTDDGGVARFTARAGRVAVASGGAAAVVELVAGKPRVASLRLP